ncbi:hypothetical protein NW765_012487 [Fusarium oxysporum]|nr:hypothetical protein NW765_012487 [Fusarium oxysporum]
MADNSDHRIKINPLMPPAKQERIHIWRTEVASALHLPHGPVPIIITIVFIRRHSRPRPRYFVCYTSITCWFQAAKLVEAH